MTNYSDISYAEDGAALSERIYHLKLPRRVLYNRRTSILIIELPD